MAKKKKTDARAYSTLVEKPELFQIEDRQGKQVKLKIYPLQLGRLALISQKLLELDMVFDNEAKDVVKQMWEVCSTKPQQVAEIVAIATLRTKEEIEEQLDSRIEELMWSPSMTPQAYVTLLQYIVFQSFHEDFMRAIRSVRTLRVEISQETKRERIASMADKPFGAK